MNQVKTAKSLLLAKLVSTIEHGSALTPEFSLEMKQEKSEARAIAEEALFTKIYVYIFTFFWRLR